MSKQSKQGAAETASPWPLDRVVAEYDARLDAMRASCDQKDEEAEELRELLTLREMRHPGEAEAIAQAHKLAAMRELLASAQAKIERLKVEHAEALKRQRAEDLEQACAAVCCVCSGNMAGFERASREYQLGTGLYIHDRDRDISAEVLPNDYEDCEATDIRAAFAGLEKESEDAD